jgi:hypothetical protein
MSEEPSFASKPIPENSEMEIKKTTPKKNRQKSRITHCRKCQRK